MYDSWCYITPLSVVALLTGNKKTFVIQSSSASRKLLCQPGRPPVNAEVRHKKQVQFNMLLLARARNNSVISSLPQTAVKSLTMNVGVAIK